MWKIFAAFMLIGAVAGRVCRPYDMTRMREAVEQQCKMYGAEDQTDKAMNGMMTFVDSVYNLTDKEGLARLQRADNEDVPTELLSFVKTTCKSQGEINALFNNMIESISPCTEPKLRGKVDEAKESIVETTDLFCKDDSKRFSEFIKDGAFPCMEQQLYSIIACTNNIQTLQTSKTLSTEEACGKLVELTTCIVEALEHCPKPSTANFAKALFRASFKGSLCSINNNEEENEKIAVNAI